jgi:hypothetical protein
MRSNMNERMIERKEKKGKWGGGGGGRHVTEVKALSFGLSCVFFFSHGSFLIGVVPNTTCIFLSFHTTPHLGVFRPHWASNPQGMLKTHNQNKRQLHHVTFTSTT